MFFKYKQKISKLGEKDNIDGNVIFNYFIGILILFFIKIIPALRINKPE